MSDPTVVCPTCKTGIMLTESLALPLIQSTRQEYEQKIRALRFDISAKETDIANRQAAVEKDREAIDQKVTQKVDAERSRISAEERARHTRSFYPTLS